MKEQKGMSHITLVIVLALIAFVIVTFIYIMNKQVKYIKIENCETDMLQIQGKVKILQQEAVMEKKDELLKGRKVEDNSETEIIKGLIDKGVISKDEENYSKYYIIDNLELEQMKLENIKVSDGYYIVNYDTLEVIYSEGVNIKDKVCYKLSEIEELKKEEQKDNKENNTTEEENKEEAKTEAEDAPEE